MENHPMTANFSFNLSELPDCACGKGKLLPAMDLSQAGTPYLKGWLCTGCKCGYLMKNGIPYEVKIYPERGNG
jgi:hypothetical protein